MGFTRYIDGQGIHAGLLPGYGFNQSERRFLCFSGTER